MWLLELMQCQGAGDREGYSSGPQFSSTVYHPRGPSSQSTWRLLQPEGLLALGTLRLGSLLQGWLAGILSAWRHPALVLCFCSFPESAASQHDRGSPACTLLSETPFLISPPSIPREAFGHRVLSQGTGCPRYPFSLSSANLLHS